MTSWRNMTYLLFFFICLKTIYLSKGDCGDYFEIAEWKNNLTENISLVDTQDPRDQIECSLERICLEKSDLRHVLYHCFNESARKTKPPQITEKCKGNTSTTIYFYNFMCLTAKAANIKQPKGCDDYETICSIKTPVFLDQTTLPPTTAAPTTQPERTTALPLTTTTTVKPMTTTQATSNVSQNADGNFHGRIATSNSTDNSTWKIPCLFSMCLNCVLLVVCLIMWYQMMRPSKDPDETVVVNYSPGRMEQAFNASHPQTAGNGFDLKPLLKASNPEQDTSNQTRTSSKDSLADQN